MVPLDTNAFLVSYMMRQWYVGVMNPSCAGSHTPTAGYRASFYVRVLVPSARGLAPGWCSICVGSGAPHVVGGPFLVTGSTPFSAGSPATGIVSPFCVGGRVSFSVGGRRAVCVGSRAPCVRGEVPLCTGGRVPSPARPVGPGGRPCRGVGSVLPRWAARRLLTLDGLVVRHKAYQHQQ